MANNIYQCIFNALMESSISAKTAQINQLCDDLAANKPFSFSAVTVQKVEVPGRPSQPELVDPRQVKRRSFASLKGRLTLMHSFAHIEFNAVNLALDAAYRFQQMPQQFTLDWLKVAQEEALHFSLINQYLQQHDASYGDYPAHNGLWDMVKKTDHDVLIRMALVPRVMEARGLDVTPKMIERFLQIKDQSAVDILSVIYQDEIGHVEIGNKWYDYCCKQQQVEPIATFKALVGEYFEGKLRGPFNRPARKQAGFSEKELNELESLT